MSFLSREPVRSHARDQRSPSRFISITALVAPDEDCRADLKAVLDTGCILLGKKSPSAPVVWRSINDGVMGVCGQHHVSTHGVGVSFQQVAENLAQHSTGSMEDRQRAMEIQGAAFGFARNANLMSEALANIQNVTSYVAAGNVRSMHPDMNLDPMQIDPDKWRAYIPDSPLLQNRETPFSYPQRDQRG